MRLTASDFYSYYRPSECELRVYLRETGAHESPPGPYAQVLRRLGERHERTHLASFPKVLDLSNVAKEEREQRTKDVVNSNTPVIYQPLLKATAMLDGLECEVVGEPDFLVNEAGGYVIRDAKISRRITENDHPEILRQVELYGWLFEQVFNWRPLKLQVYAGTGDLVDLPYDGGQKALEVLLQILQKKQLKVEPYSPVGWTKCGGCGFCENYCWPRAERERDVALVNELDQGLARALRQDGIQTYDDLLSGFDTTRLEMYQRPWGRRMQRVGKKAEAILRNAKVLISGKEILLQPPAVPSHANYVMFDLEGLPPQLDELEKIYLWGLQVYGKEPSSYQAAVGGIARNGDYDGWMTFLNNAERIFSKYAEIPFVHWHHYERGRLDMYVDRYGDPNGIAARIRQNLLDLLPITQRSIALPLPSYSLKVVEKYVGFKRSLPEGNGEWAMAKYIEATETDNEVERVALIDEISSYNQEDLAATWAVLNWLKRFDV